MRDLSHNIGVATVMAPAVQAATVTSEAFDLLNFNAFALLVTTGAIVGAGNFTAKLQHMDTTAGGSFADVPSADLIDALPDSLAADTVIKVGYKGGKRYLRVVLTKNGGTSIAVGVVLIKGASRNRPVA